MIALGDQQLTHLRKSLRITGPMEITYSNGAGRLGSGLFDGAEVVRGEERSVERPTTLSMAVAPPRAKERQRFLVEKLQELGVATLLWLRTAHGVGKVPASKRTAAWAQAALEQSQGAWLMEIGGETFLEDFDRPILVCDRGGGSIPTPGVTTILVGPEGGWAPGEIDPAIPRWSLGETVFRVETAAIVAAARLIIADGNG